MIENDLSFDENINDINFIFHDFPLKIILIMKI